MRATKGVTLLAPTRRAGRLEDGPARISISSVELGLREESLCNALRSVADPGCAFFDALRFVLRHVAVTSRSIRRHVHVGAFRRQRGSASIS